MILVKCVKRSGQAPENRLYKLVSYNKTDDSPKCAIDVEGSIDFCIENTPKVLRTWAAAFHNSAYKIIVVCSLPELVVVTFAE